MIEFGKTLRAAREAKGLSVEQLAKATCMLSRVVNDLENEEFSHLPAPIYGRGFVKIYCEEVGLDPKPMVAEFMELLNGRRDAGDRESASAPAKPAPVPPPEAPEPIAASEPPQRPPIAPVPADDLFTAANEPAAPKASRYAADYDKLLSSETGAGWTPSPSIWRWVAVGAVAVAFLTAVAFGIRALYRATSSDPAPIDDTTATALDESAKAAAAAKKAPEADERAKQANKARTPIDIPPLYL